MSTDLLGLQQALLMGILALRKLHLGGEMPNPERCKTPSDVMMPRLFAFIIDTVVLVALIALVVLPVDVALPLLGFGDSTAMSAGAVALISAGIMWVYFTVPEALFGSTVGKLALGIRVVCADTGDKPDLRQASIRNAWRFIEILPLGIPALLATLSSPLRQRLGDRWARTLVVGR